MVEKIEGMTLEEFVRLYDQEGPFELIDGKRIPVSPTVSGHQELAKQFFLALLPYEQVHKLGEVFFEASFVLTQSTSWVKGSRLPDVMFVSKERLVAFRALPDAKHKPYILVPNLVVEIISPTDNRDAVMRKIDLYLQDGVQIVWLVDMERKTVTVYSAGSSQPTILTVSDMLDGGTVLPGFGLTVSTLFE
jgi:Uma2 family endonuclease